MKKLQNVKVGGRGFTLVEVGIVVAIGLLLLAGLVGAGRIIAGTKANDEVGALKTAVANIQKSYSAANTFDGLTTQAARDLKIFPANLDDPGNAAQLISRWGQALNVSVVGAAVAPHPANSIAAITVTNVPTYECVNVIPQVQDQMLAIEVLAGGAAPAVAAAPVLAADGAAIGAIGATYAKNTTVSGAPLFNAAFMGAACDTATGNADIVYYFRK